jgi:hypothetical protein
MPGGGALCCMGSGIIAPARAIEHLVRSLSPGRLPEPQGSLRPHRDVRCGPNGLRHYRAAETPPRRDPGRGSKDGLGAVRLSDVHAVSPELTRSLACCGVVLVKEAIMAQKRRRPSRRKVSKVNLWRRAVRLGKAFAGIVGTVKALWDLWQALAGDGSWPFPPRRFAAGGSLHDLSR